MKSTGRPSLAARGTAVGLALVLAGGGALIAAAPAVGDDAPTTVHAGDIRPNGETYAGWHQAYSGATSANYGITADGLKLTNESQIIYGFVETTRLSGGALSDLITDGDIRWSTKSGTDAAYFQLPVAYGDSAGPSFTTLRPSMPTAGDNTAAWNQDWVSSTAIPGSASNPDGVAANTPAKLQDLVADLGISTIQVLGFGVRSAPGTTSVVTGLHFNRTSYVFALDPLPAGTASLSGNETVGSTLTVTPAGWPAGTTFTYEWFYSGGQFGGAIDGAADAPTYTLTAAETALQVGVIVTGHKDGFEATQVHSNMTDWVVDPQKTAAPAPVAGSDVLPAYLASKGVTPGDAASAGLPATVDASKGTVATVQWAGNDSFVDVYAYSSPVLVGTFPVVNGVAQITLSAGLLASIGSGAHTLVITGQSSGTVQAVAFSVSAVAPAAVLADTGSNLAFPATAAGLLLLAGGTLLVIRRRRARSA